jgi:hypothetical protein
MRAIFAKDPAMARRWVDHARQEGRPVIHPINAPPIPGPAEREALVGRRVRLVHHEDGAARDLVPGTEGTIRFVDDHGTHFVDWDTGHRLGLIPGLDRFVLLDDEALRRSA